MIDYDYGRKEALHARAEMIRSFIYRTGLNRKVAISGTALGLAVTLFWATMLIAPPVTEAADAASTPISTMFDGAAACIASFVCP